MSDSSEKPKRGPSDDTTRGTDNHQMRVAGAVVLIGLGVIFLLQEFGLNIPLFDHWWAFFILIPAVGLLWGAYQKYTSTGGWTPEARGQLVGGAMALLVACIFLFNLDWGKIWPLFMIVPGVFLLFGWH